MTTEAAALFRTRRTVWLVRKPYLSEPVLTTDIPCGPALAVSLGRYTQDAMPTEREIASDLLGARQELSRKARAQA